jgi:hypothetical protein
LDDFHHNIYWEFFKLKIKSVKNGQKVRFLGICVVLGGLVSWGACYGFEGKEFL